MDGSLESAGKEFVVTRSGRICIESGQQDNRWSSVPEDAIKELNKDGDGGFWMAYGDFLKYFKVS